MKKNAWGVATMAEGIVSLHTTKRKCLEYIRDRTGVTNLMLFREGNVYFYAARDHRGVQSFAVGRVEDLVTEGAVSSREATGNRSGS